MKTRTSILAVLASGVLLSSGGVAMGVSGLAAGDSAATAQYGQEQPNGGNGPQNDTGGQPKQEVLGATATRPGTKALEVAQPTQQEAAQGSGDELPFTGYAAIPVLLLGLGLLGTGIVMRRRTPAEDTRG